MKASTTSKSITAIVLSLVLAGCGNSETSTQTSSSAKHRLTPAQRAEVEAGIKGILTIGGVEHKMSKFMCLKRMKNQVLLATAEEENDHLRVSMKVLDGVTTTSDFVWTDEYEGGRTLWFTSDLTNNSFGGPVFHVSGVATALVSIRKEDGKYYQDGSAPDPEPQDFSLELYCS